MEMLRWQVLDSDWMWGRKGSSESGITPRSLACGGQVDSSAVDFDREVRGRGMWGNLVHGALTDFFSTLTLVQIKT